jgi:hypothetical protein
VGREPFSPGHLHDRAISLMLRIRNQFPRDSEEQHRKHFIEMVRNGDWQIREEIVKSLFAVYLNRAYR